MFTTKLNSSRLSLLQCCASPLPRSSPRSLVLYLFRLLSLALALPALAILAGGYWLIRKFRERR